MKKNDSEKAQREYFERLKEGCRSQVPKIYQALLDSLKLNHLGDLPAPDQARLAQEVPILIFALFLGTQTDDVLAPLMSEVPMGIDAPFPPHLSRLRITPRGKAMASEMIAGRWEEMATMAHAVRDLKVEESMPSMAEAVDPISDLLPHLLRHTECAEVKAVTKPLWLRWFDRWPGLGFLLARRSLSLSKPKAAQELIDLGAQEKSEATLSQIRAVCDRNWTPLKSGMLQMAEPKMKSEAKAPRAAADPTPRPILARRRGSDLSVLQSQPPKLKAVGNWNYAAKSAAHAQTSADKKLMRAIEAQMGAPSVLKGTLLS